MVRRAFLPAIGMAWLISCSGEEDRTALQGPSSETVGISGAIFQSDGKGVPGARLTWRPESLVPSAPGAADSGRIGESRTDANGRFRLRLRKGGYLIEVRGGDGSALLLRVPAGLSEDEIRFPPDTLRPTGGLSGRLLFADSVTPAGARVEVYGMSHASAVGKDGAFSLDSLPTGRYSLRLSLPDLDFLSRDLGEFDVPVSDRNSIAPIRIPYGCGTAACDTLLVRALFDSLGLQPSQWKTRTRLNASTHRVESLILDQIGMARCPSLVAGLQGLLSLNLSFNRLSALPPELASIPGLVSLYAFNNRFTELPEVLFRLDSLDLIEFQVNAVSTLPAQVGRLRKLRLIDLRFNRLSSLPQELTELPALRVIKLDSNAFTEVPQVLLALTDLKALFFSQNNLGALPPGFSRLKALDFLELRGAGLRGFPEVIYDLTALEHLAIGNNNGFSLGPKVNRLGRLAELEIADTDLDSLPGEIGDLKSLTRLDLRQNRLKALPSSLRGLSGLDFVRVDGNALCGTDPEMGAWLDARSPAWRPRQNCP